MSFIEAIKQLVLELGAGGIFVATALEYGCFPVSSEILLPFIGYVVAVNGYSLFYTIMIATFGGMIGTTTCYLVGRIGGRMVERLAERFESIALGVGKAQSIFLKYGKESVFFARLFPIARTYISFPAGLAKMPAVPFILYTTVGVFLWNTALISAGYFLGTHWDICKEFLKAYQWQLSGAIALLVILFIVMRNRSRKKSG
ncbi:DedA family protein [Anaerotignum sp. MB30-C6]|uniref:DedA family protein n=1 Tax=Anaerotignum sp. MB30-C6 TaxID=3070814 RepID=UPI0027DE5352|nr:DedA family protein [Anaerotignum sp. MB30-C6]WMI82286.1 DedA family protein [Anaerotignum sp. MB30-C6]